VAGGATDGAQLGIEDPFEERKTKNRSVVPIL